MVSTLNESCITVASLCYFRYSLPSVLFHSMASAFSWHQVIKAERLGVKPANKSCTYSLKRSRSTTTNTCLLTTVLLAPSWFASIGRETSRISGTGHFSGRMTFLSPNRTEWYTGVLMYARCITPEKNVTWSL